MPIRGVPANAFVAINCATMAPDRIEAELFGEEVDGELRKIGLFEVAHNGTLYLDEVSDMPLETQGKILRVLVDQTFQRIGGTTRVQVDARVVSSTVRDLRAEIAAGRFREDLYHRLNVVPVRVPSLSERRDDIPHAGRPFHEAAFGGQRPAHARHRRRRDGGAAGP